VKGPDLVDLASKRSSSITVVLNHYSATPPLNKYPLFQVLLKFKVN